MRDKIAGIVILYNPEPSLVNNIASYFNFVDILYVWRNSTLTNDIENSISTLFGSKVIWLGDKENRGIGVALNAALVDAKEKGAKWLLTMDQDSKFPPGSLELLIDSAFSISEDKNQRVGIFAANHIVNGSPSHKQNIETDEPDWVMMSGNLVNLGSALDCGGFNEDLFIDGVDIEFCRRMITTGRKVHICHDAQLEHQLGNARRINFLGYKTTTTNHSPVRLYYIFRNYLYMGMCIECCKSIQFQLYKFLIHKIGCVVLFENKKMNKLMMIAKGCCHFMLKKIGKF